MRNFPLSQTFILGEREGGGQLKLFLISNTLSPFVTSLCALWFLKFLRECFCLLLCRIRIKNYHAEREAVPELRIVKCRFA